MEVPYQPRDLRTLALTSRVLQEAMRMYPPAPAVVRRVEHDTIVCGYRVPAGADLVVSIWALHRDPAIWHDPTRFDPDRFLPSAVEQRDRWAYLPFGAGPRSCIGDHFALTEATIALVSLTRKLRIESMDDTFPMAVPFTLTAEGRVPARITPRS
ncbi:MAG: cytochrome P450 [Nitriliruptorales bacterium]